MCGSAIALWLVEKALGGQPRYATYERRVEGRDVIVTTPASGKRGFARNAGFITRLFAIVFVAAFLAGMTLRIARGASPTTTTHVVNALLAVSINLIPVYVWLWFWSTVHIVFRIEPDRLRYSFSSCLARFVREWARDDVTAVQWNHGHFIRIRGRGGEIQGHMLLPWPMGERTRASLAFGVRTAWGF